MNIVQNNINKSINVDKVLFPFFNDLCYKKNVLLAVIYCFFGKRLNIILAEAKCAQLYTNVPG